MGWRLQIVVFELDKKMILSFCWGRGGVPGRGRQRRELGGGGREVEGSGGGSGGGQGRGDRGGRGRQRRELGEGGGRTNDPTPACTTAETRRPVRGLGLGGEAFPLYPPAPCGCSRGWTVCV